MGQELPSWPVDATTPSDERRAARGCERARGSGIQCPFSASFGIETFEDAPFDLYGARFLLPDPYLFQLARGAAELDFPLPEPLCGYMARIEGPPAVQAALRREGLA